MHIIIKEAAIPFWEDENVNLVVNGICNHAQTDLDEIEGNIGPDSPFSTNIDRILVCQKCDAWRYVGDDEWHNEMLLETEPVRTSQKLVLR